eukprot:1439904-Rhodomonas_salina.1
MAAAASCDLACSRAETQRLFQCGIARCTLPCKMKTANPVAQTGFFLRFDSRGREREAEGGRRRGRRR